MPPAFMDEFFNEPPYNSMGMPSQEEIDAEQRKMWDEIAQNFLQSFMQYRSRDNFIDEAMKRFTLTRKAGDANK